ncbi:unnamed protein product [Cyprideis torosa]|uniref:Uncharacterized protein n=1 Tax=Cyprideis torosa TaxID=163714 RepID=A0A7R8ZIS0_9CRUS|nr:unnamed protein product [Cyprideis torosa]CAG0886841.1 unnamed protein product [Cyprideis torosa]
MSDLDKILYFIPVKIDVPLYFRKTLTLEERSEEVHSLEEELVRRVNRWKYYGYMSLFLCMLFTLILTSKLKRLFISSGEQQQDHQESQNRLLEVQAKYLTTLEAKASLSDTVQTMTAEEGSRKKESIRLRDQLRSMQALIEANSKAAEGAKKEKKKVLEELQKLRTEKDQVISRLSEYSERVSEGKSLLQEKLSEKEQEVEALKEQLQEKITQEQRNKIAQEQRNKIAQEQRNKREEEEAPSLEGLTERLNQEVATSTALDRKLFSLFRSEDPSTSSTLSYEGTTSSEENEEDGPAGVPKEGRAKGQRHAPGVASGSGEEVETVRKIQRLLRRVHKEGRQVLALSELPSPSPGRKSAASPSASRNGKTGTDARTKDPTSANGNKTQGATGSTPPEGGHCEECKKLREKSFQSVAMVKQLREKDEEIKSLKSHLKKQEENYRLFTEKIDKFLDVQKELDEEESKIMRLKAQTDRQAAEHEKELRNQSVRWRNEVEQEAQRLREDQGELASSALVEELQRENGRLKKESEEMNMFLLETVEKKLELEKMVGVLHGQLERSSQPCSDSEASYPTHLSVALRESEKEASRLREQLSLLQAVLDEGAFHQGGVQTGTGEVNMGTLIYVFHKFEREQSYRRNLAYQKKYLIVLLRKLKADLARHAGGVAMNPAFQSLILAGVVLSRGRRTFRIYVFVVIAIRRMEYLVRLWKRRYRVAIQEGASSPTHLVVPPHSPRSQSPSPMRHDRASVARTRGSRSRERPPLPGGSDNVRLLRRIEESISQSQDVLLSHSTPPSSPFRANCLRRPEAPRGAYGDDAPTATVYQQQRHNWDGGEPLYHITGRTPPTRDKRDKSKRRLISPPRRSSSPDSVRSSQSSSTPIPLNDVLGCGRGITNVSIPVPLSFGAPQSQFRNSRLQQPSMRLWSRPAD